MSAVRLAAVRPIAAAPKLETLRLDGGRLVVQQLRTASPGAPKVLCFPFAGGGPSAFKAFADKLPAGWGVWAIDFPGHVRTRGEACTTVEQMVAECLRLVPSELLNETFFVGYSLGAYVAHGLAAALEKQGRVIPGVVIAGSTPPSARDRSAAASKLSDEGRFQWLMKLGQTQDNAPQRELYQVFKDAIHGDLKAFDSYEPTAVLDAPALVLGGSNDPMCRPEQFSGWQSLTFDPEVKILPGGHFFLNTCPDAFAGAVTKFVDQLTRTASTMVSTVPEPMTSTVRLIA